jgi:hypothetical protein
MYNYSDLDLASKYKVIKEVVDKSFDIEFWKKAAGKDNGPDDYGHSSEYYVEGENVYSLWSMCKQCTICVCKWAAQGSYKTKAAIINIPTNTFSGFRRTVQQVLV